MTHITDVDQAPESFHLFIISSPVWETEELPRHTITLFVADGKIVARFSEPQVCELFGTDVIPTPFLVCANHEEVLACIRKRNPDCLVHWQS